MQDQARMTITDWGWLLLLSVLWGGSFCFVKVIVQEVPPFTLVLTRFALAAWALWIYLRMWGVPIPRSLVAWVAFAGMGALNNLIPAALIAISQTVLTSGLASILIATTPIFSIFAAHCLTTDEKMCANKAAGMLLGIAGVVTLVGADSLDGSERSIVAILECLAAALSYGLANVFGRQFKRMGIVPAAGAFGQIMMTALMVLPMALIFDAPWLLPVPSVEVWVSMAGLSLVSTALAYVVFFRILASGGGTNVSLVTLLIPISATLLASVFLGEHLLVVQFMGMALIGLGLAAIDGRAWNAIRQVIASRDPG